MKIQVEAEDLDIRVAGSNLQILKNWQPDRSDIKGRRHGNNRGVNWIHLNPMMTMIIIRMVMMNQRMALLDQNQVK